MANQTVRIDQLGTAISSMLEGYSEEVKQRADEAGERAVTKLVKLTKASAPVDSGAFKKSITWSMRLNKLGAKEYYWHVKAPHYRLTHLLVHGHALVNGDRTDGDPFLHKALDEVLPEYVEDIEEAMIE